MNSQYLFSKEGSDAEIERMEDLLSVYRIEPLAPALNRAFAAEKRSTRVSFRFLFAYIGVIGSLAAVVIIAAMVFTRQTVEPEEVAAISPAVVIPAATTGDDPTSAYSIAGSSTTSASKVVEPDRPAVVRTSYARTSRPVIKYQRPGFTTSKLTAEEKYAYEQVKVALFLAGSKLKIVQDTIDRTGDGGNNTFTDKR